jgi:GH15 family glucan-1,4-alpha-glucosidase
VLHSPGDVYPGPYTYKPFWFRDAAFIVHALLCAGLTQRAERALDRFPERQTLRGYFRSQEGEWDANGEALWMMQRFCGFSGQALKPAWRGAIERGAQWIINKRLAEDLDGAHAGLLAAGFSAEHLGPNDYYYWDDFWAIAGLRAAASLLQGFDKAAATRYTREADGFRATVDRCLARGAQRLGRHAVPASPYRRLDAGVIGSLAMGYPLQLCAANDARLLVTVSFLLERCFVDGAFFQDMTHSGLNAYLTPHIAQVLLRAGDLRYLDIVDTVVGLASPPGQWPEAIHPRTRGGCMGDGHHVWAAAEWVVMLRKTDASRGSE